MTSATSAKKTRDCIVCGKPLVRRPDGVCSDCAPRYYGLPASDSAISRTRYAVIREGKEGTNENHALPEVQNHGESGLEAQPG